MPLAPDNRVVAGAPADSKPGAAPGSSGAHRSSGSSAGASARFNASQRKAIDHQDGPAAVLAVAGSGKTTVLIHRIARLLESGVPPTAIVGVTFTKKAAGEMRDRLDKLVPFSDAVTLKTFHALAYGIIHQAEGKAPNLLTGGQAAKLMREVAQEHRIPDAPADLLRAVGFLMNSNVAPEDLDCESFLGIRLPALTIAYREYRFQKSARQVRDFDDLLVDALALLRQGGRRPWTHFMVDEFQDTNVVQIEMLKALCPPETKPNLMVVGDDDQGIYSWRAARPEFLIEFKKHWPGAKIIRMQDNYRCSGAVVGHANALIHVNLVRAKKRLKAHLPEGVAVRCESFAGPIEEAGAVAESIRAALTERKAGDHAVLYRTNAQSGPLEEKLVEARIPYRIVGGTGFYGRMEIQDMLAYARLAVNPADDEALERIFNVPNRFLGKASMTELRRTSQVRGVPLSRALRLTDWSRPFMRKGAEQLANILGTCSRQAHQPPGDFLRDTASLVGMEAHLAKEGDGEPDEGRWQNVETLFLMADKFRSLGDFLFHVENMKRHADDKGGDAVTLMTLHRAKGLEWPVVFVTGVSHGLLPHARAENIEEERRLFYVGMTRAKEELRISSVDTYRKSAGPSRFIGEANLVMAMPRKEKVYAEGGGDSEGLRGTGELPLPGGGADEGGGGEDVRGGADAAGREGGEAGG